MIEDVCITEGKWYFEVSGHPPFSCGFIDGCYPLDRMTPLNAPSRHKWVWLAKTLTGVTDRIIRDVNDISVHRGDYVTVVCRIDCSEGKIAFRMKTEYRWTVVATHLVTTSCFIPVVAAKDIKDLEIVINSVKNPEDNYQWLENAIITRIWPTYQTPPARKKTIDSDSIQYLRIQLLLTILTRWKASLNLTSVLSLTDQSDDDWVLPILMDILHNREASPHVLFQQILALKSSDKVLWMLLRDLVFLELWKELQQSRIQMDVVEKCLHELSPEWCM